MQDTYLIPPYLPIRYKLPLPKEVFSHAGGIDPQTLKRKR